MPSPLSGGATTLILIIPGASAVISLVIRSVMPGNMVLQPDKDVAVQVQPDVGVALLDGLVQHAMKAFKPINIHSHIHVFPYNALSWGQRVPQGSRRAPCPAPSPACANGVNFRMMIIAVHACQGKAHTRCSPERLQAESAGTCCQVRLTCSLSSERLRGYAIVASDG